ncbi:MAG TPA: hypothetical protein VGD57_02525, partial [Candidatus Dormibacteraeota bacterium]
MDHHCHPLRRWPFELGAVDLRAVFSEAIDPQIARDHMPQTVAYRIALRYIADELGCEPEEHAILAARKAAEPVAYARRLLERSRTGMLLLDSGFTGGDGFSLDQHATAT